MIPSSLNGIAAFGLASGLLAGGVSAFMIRQRRIRHHLASKYATRFMYSGSISKTSLLDAIQFLELGRREGILHVYIGRRKGYITFVEGEVVDAFFRNTTGRDAVFAMLDAEYGEFSFESKVIRQPRLIAERIMDIALEWDARRHVDDDERRDETGTTIMARLPDDQAEKQP